MGRVPVPLVQISEGTEAEKMAPALVSNAMDRGGDGNGLFLNVYYSPGSTLGLRAHALWLGGATPG